MRLLERRGFLTAFATLALFTVLAGDAWRNSISWYGFGALAGLLTAVSVAVLVRHRAIIRPGSLPWPLVAFLGLATVSIAWSFYPGASAIGVFAQVITTLAALAIALVLTGDELLRAFGWALRAILVLSLAFELVVSLVVRAPVLPVWATAADRVDPPLMLYWSRNLLLEGDRIQGIVGNSGLLGMIALIGLIVFGVQLAAGSVRRPPGVLWLALAASMLALTRSATVTVALVAVLLVLAMILALRRAASPRARLAVYGGIMVVLAGVAGSVLAFRPALLGLLGKSDDLTGRLDIWDAVIGLAVQRPVFGWGWISFWAPWVEPFDDLVSRNGVIQLHAHNAWLDVWLQLGVVGLVVFGALVATTAIRSWLLATDRVVTGQGDRGSFSSLSLLPPLLLTALVVQSLAESRILVEGGWVLLVILAVTTKLGMLGRLRRTPANGRTGAPRAA
jgi:O-antigen ligase